MVIRKKSVLLGLAIGVGFGAFTPLAAPPEPPGSESATDKSVDLPITALTCPFCHARGQLVPIVYGFSVGRPKPTVADGVTCPPPENYAAGCVSQSVRWHCKSCPSQYTFLPKKTRLEAITLCVRELKDGSTCRRRAAGYLLSFIDLVGSDAIAALANAIDDKDSLVRTGAIHALVPGPLGGRRYSDPEDMRIAERLIAKLEDEAASVRASAVYALLLLEPHSATVIPALARVLDDTDPDVRWFAANAITAISRNSVDTETPPSVAPALIELLGHPSATVRVAIAESVGQIGRDAGFAIPALERLLKDEDRVVQLTARNSLYRIKPPD